MVVLAIGNWLLTLVTRRWECTGIGCGGALLDRTVSVGRWDGGVCDEKPKHSEANAVEKMRRDYSFAAAHAARCVVAAHARTGSHVDWLSRSMSVIAALDTVSTA